MTVLCSVESMAAGDRILCRIGLHRWAWRERVIERNGRRTLYVMYRCSHRCSRHPDWHVVHMEHLSPWR